MRILGLSAYYHDSAAAIIKDGHIVAAAQEERFTRHKHDSAFPFKAIAYCLSEENLTLKDVDLVVFYDKPFAKFERILETHLAYAPKGFSSFRKSMPLWLREKLFQKAMLVKELRTFDPEFEENRLLFSEHHFSHAASAFYPSPFNEAVVLTMDGVGEWATTSVAVGHKNFLQIVKEIHFPHSLGLLYSAITYYLGFKVNSGEYKVMGLAPYGEPKFVNLILENLIDIKPDGSYRLNQIYFDYCVGLTMTNNKFDALFDAPARKDNELLTQRHMDIAASLQAVIEHAVLSLTRSLAKEFGLSNLCLAGGVALNCVANGKVYVDGAFKNIWVQPASGDAGGAVGAALAAYHHHLSNPRPQVENGKDHMKGAYLGPAFEQSDIEARLAKIGAHFVVVSDDELMNQCAHMLAGEKALGWVQGRMEYGPRALGNRSILGDPRSPRMQSALNLKVKYRESFRPFAPSVLREDLAQWFDMDIDSPYMLMVAAINKNRCIPMTEEQKALFGIEKLNIPRSEIPAVTHVDYSARIQTVHGDTNPRYYALISRFKEITGCPVLINTSFNVRGEPIVCTPEDAFRCFMGCEIDAMAIGNCLLLKSNQSELLKRDYKNAFDPD